MAPAVCYMYCVQCTSMTVTFCSVLQDKGYLFEPRGEVEIKGKGKMLTYFLESRCLSAEQQVSLKETPTNDVTAASLPCQDHSNASVAEAQVENYTPSTSAVSKKDKHSKVCLVS